MKYLVALVIWFAVSLGAQAGTFVEWSDLVDAEAQQFDDPFRDLSLDQIDDVRTVFVERGRLADQSVPQADRALAEARLTEALSRLSAEGLDADWLLSQRWVVAENRKRAATAGNPEIDGQTITLAGFALAAPPDEDGTPIAYLVPERGMCSHLPPPNPNQLIRLRLSGDWTPGYAHEPVRLTGTLSIFPTSQVFHVVDGPLEMNATFEMAAQRVETLEDMRAQADADATREWAKQISDRLRASGVQPHSERGASE